jgi:hypothetical protein
LIIGAPDARVGGDEPSQDQILTATTPRRKPVISILGVPELVKAMRA